MSDLGGVRHAQDAFAEEVMCGNVQPEILWVVGGDQFGGDGGGDAPRDTGEFEDGVGVSTVRVLTVAEE